MAKLPELPDATSMGQRPELRPSTGIAQMEGATGYEHVDAQNLRTAGSELDQAANYLWKAKDEYDNTVAQDAANKLNQERLKQAYDPNDGFLAMKGAAAADPEFAKKQLERFQQSAETIGGNLTDPNQKRLFARHADVIAKQQQATIYEHAAKETLQHRIDINTSTIDTAKQAVAKLADPGPGVLDPDPAKRFDQNADNIKVEIAKAEAAIDNLAKMVGKDDEGSKGWVAAQKAKLRDDIYTDRILSVSYSDPIKADALFRMYQGEFTNPEKKLVLQHKLREASMGVQAVNEADSIINEVRSAPTAIKPTSGEPAGDGFMKVSEAEQMKRDETRLAILRDELKTNPDDKALKRELELAEAKQAAGKPFSGRGSATLQTTEPTTEINTSGLPNARDIRAQLPVMLSKVESRADQLYGADKTNPDRAAFVARLTNELKGKISLEVTQLEAFQKQAQGNLIDVVAGFNGGRPVTAFSQIQADPKAYRDWQLLDPQAKLGVQRLIESNARGDTAENDKLYWDVFKRIHLEPGNPQKIDFYQQILDYAGPDKLNMRQISLLRNEIDRAETPGGRSVNQLMKASSAKVESYFRNNMMFTQQPERQIAATMRWVEDAGKKIDAYVKENKDTRTLFMLDSPDSIVNPKYLQTYVDSTPAQGLAEQAAAVRKGSVPAVQGLTPEQVAKVPQIPAGLQTREEVMAWIDKLPPEVTTVRDENGIPRLIPSRQRKAEGKVK